MPKKRKRTSNVWKTLERDSRGRWISREETMKLKNSRSQIKKTADLSKKRVKTIQQAQEVLDRIKKEFIANCPRCAGKMVNHTIRCGPNRTVKVRKCTICNFWIPLE